MKSFFAPSSTLVAVVPQPQWVVILVSVIRRNHSLPAFLRNACTDAGSLR
jgi:hypothetical protein